jgi:2-oxoglutarate ferredoxin oxidoreductase subunit alpha
MQARWGTHGGPEIIALAPWSSQEMYDLTARAFNLSERFRVPVIVLADEVVGHLRETVVIPPTVQSYNRARWPQDAPFGTESDDGVPPMPAFGEGAKLMVTGSTHDEKGVRRASDAATQERLVVAYGSAARSALWAVQEARQQGCPVGLLRLSSLWPFPDEAIARHAQGCREVIVPEMNLGQVAREVQRCVSAPVVCLSQADGELINPRRILHYLLEGKWTQ